LFDFVGLIKNSELISKLDLLENYLDMKKIIVILTFTCFMAFESFSQLQIGGGPALFACEKYFERSQGSIDYTLSAGYAIRKFDVGFEFVQNGYRDDGRGKSYYEFYQYQLFGRYYPLKKRILFIKAGINYSDEKYHDSMYWGTPPAPYQYDEHGKLLGLEGGLGFQDRLIKKADLFMNVSLTYNYLKSLESDYVSYSHEEPMPFYALKMSLIYQFNFKKK